MVLHLNELYLVGRCDFPGMSLVFFLALFLPQKAAKSQDVLLP